jgi:hypothetical protein
MTDAVERARQIAKNVLGDRYDPLLACREIAGITDELPAVDDEVMNVFIGVASEVDHYPLGPERAYWNPESLRMKDLQAADYRARVGGIVAEALQRLLEAIGNDSGSGRD